MKIPAGKLIDDGDSRDEKSHFVRHENEEFSISIDTDDCDRKLAIKMTKELIRRWNSFEV